MYQKVDGPVDIHNRVDNKIDMGKFIGSYDDRCFLWTRNDDMSGTKSKDWSFNRQDSTITGAAWRAEGKFKTHCLYFDGSDDNINLGPVDFLPANMTVECWAKTTATTEVYMVSKGTGSNYCWGLGLWNRYTTFRLWTCAGVVYLGVSGPINADNDGLWHHFVGVLENAIVAYLYVDGQLIGIDNTISGTRCTNQVANTLIGRRQDGLVWNGNIDEVRVYSRALTADEIRKRYEMGRQPPL